MAVSNPRRNPRTGEPSTLCECGAWNDSRAIPGNKYKKRSERYEKAYQCSQCGRQLVARYHPEEHADTKDQVKTGEQFTLKKFMRCPK